MKKKISLVLAMIMVSLSLTACGKFTCDMCGQEKSGKNYSVEVMGEKASVCKECYDEIKELQKEMQDLFN